MKSSVLMFICVVFALEAPVYGGGGGDDGGEIGQANSSFI